MRFLIDQDVYAITTRLLREWGHDVITAADLNLSRASDAQLLEKAEHESRILVTRDKDYGALVFVEQKTGGVILLRMRSGTASAVHEQLEHVLETYSEEQIFGSFIVVEEGQYRYRKITRSS